MAEKSRREVLAEAFDEAEKDERTEKQPEGEQPAAEPIVDEGGSAEGGEGAERTDKRELGEGEEGGGKQKVEAKKEEKDDKDKKVEEKDEKGKKETPYEKERKAAAEPRERLVTDKPPASWRAGAKESWAKLPPAVRQEVTKREGEIQRELSQTAVVRKFSAELANIIRPHSQTIQSMNTTPLAAIDSLLKTASGLAGGNAEVRARIVADIIGNYHIDIPMLDKILAKQPIPDKMKNGGDPNPNSVPDWAKPIFSFMTDAQTARQQREIDLQTEAESEVAEAAHNMPFLDDLRDEVADILEISARRGKVVTLEEAYNRAVAMDPEVSQVVAQRKAAADKTKSDSLARARRAASTVSGAPRGRNAGGEGKVANRREAIERAWEAAET